MLYLQDKSSRHFSLIWLISLSEPSLTFWPVFMSHSNSSATNSGFTRLVFEFKLWEILPIVCSIEVIVDGGVILECCYLEDVPNKVAKTLRVPSYFKAPPTMTSLRYNCHCMILRYWKIHVRAAVKLINPHRIWSFWNISESDINWGIWRSLQSKIKELVQPEQGSSDMWLSELHERNIFNVLMDVEIRPNSYTYIKCREISE